MFEETVLLHNWVYKFNQFIDHHFNVIINWKIDSNKFMSLKSSISGISFSDHFESIFLNFDFLLKSF